MEIFFKICPAIMILAELMAAIAGIVYFKRLKSRALKFFVVYLVFIFLQEFYFFTQDNLLSLSKVNYYSFIGVPVQFLFFYWFFAYHSLKRKKLFYGFVFIYLLILCLGVLLSETKTHFSLSYEFGVLLLSVLILVEFIKQVRSNEILYFGENKMFYIMLGVIVGYIGTYPFNVFFKQLYEIQNDIWIVFYLIFIALFTLTYLLFAASFIWGTRQS